MEGINILLLRGLTRESRHWGQFPKVFQERLGTKAKIHLLDLPGVGTERHRQSPWTIEGMYQDVAARWEKLRSAESGSWAVVAISLGAMLALHWIGQNPQAFSRAVLINTSSNLSPVWDRLAFANIPNVLKTTLIRDPFQRERHVLSMTTRLLGNLDELASQWAGYLRETPPARGVALRQIAAALSFRVPPKLSTKLLFLASKQDGFTNPYCSNVLARHLNAPLIQHDSGGHDLSLDDPQWLAERCAEFLS